MPGGWSSVHGAWANHPSIMNFRCQFCNCQGVPAEWNEKDETPLTKCKACNLRFCPKHIHDHYCKGEDHEEDPDGPYNDFELFLLGEHERGSNPRDKLGADGKSSFFSPHGNQENSLLDGSAIAESSKPLGSFFPRSLDSSIPSYSAKAQPSAPTKSPAPVVSNGRTPLRQGGDPSSNLGRRTTQSDEKIEYYYDRIGRPYAICPHCGRKTPAWHAGTRKAATMGVCRWCGKRWPEEETFECGAPKSKPPFPDCCTLIWGHHCQMEGKD